MPAATLTKFQCLTENLAEKVHNLETDTLKIMLTNVAPNAATNTVKADITEIAAGNGYTAGGNTVAVTSSAQASGTYKLVLADTTFTGSGAGMATFRYAILYNDTPTTPLKPLIAYLDYGSALSLGAGDAMVVDFDPTNGAIQWS